MARKDQQSENKRKNKTTLREIARANAGGKKKSSLTCGNALSRVPIKDLCCLTFPFSPSLAVFLPCPQRYLPLVFSFPLFLQLLCFFFVLAYRFCCPILQALLADYLGGVVLFSLPCECQVNCRDWWKYIALIAKCAISAIKIWYRAYLNLFSGTEPPPTSRWS